jgi:hypothetical protein
MTVLVVCSIMLRYTVYVFNTQWRKFEHICEVLLLTFKYFKSRTLRTYISHNKFRVLTKILSQRKRRSLYTKTFYAHIKQTSPSKRGCSLFKFISPPDCTARCSAVYDVSIVTLQQERVWWSMAPTFSFVFCYSIVISPHLKLRQFVTFACPLQKHVTNTYLADLGSRYFDTL